MKRMESNRSNLKCVVHYPLAAKYSPVIPLNENTFTRITTAKNLREKWRGNNLHAEQCSTVPSEIELGVSGVHMTPCYKKFTLFIAQCKDKRDDKEAVTDNRHCRQRQKDTVGKSLFPKYCFFCKGVRKRVGGNNTWCHLLLTKQAEAKIKQKAELQNDTDMLLHIRGVDLIAKEFQMHDSCYKNYIRESSDLGNSSCSGENQGDFEAVKVFIQENVIELNQAVSMTKVHEIYSDGHEGDARYRGKLKQRLEKCFGNDAIQFVTINHNTPQVIINTAGLSETTTIKNKDIIINLAAKYLKEDIQSFASKVPELNWPPTVTELEDREESIPNSVKSFLESLLKSPGHPNREKWKILVRSYSNDLIHGVTRGKVMTLKHFLVGLGLHNLTGQKVPIQILSHLGHSLDYNVVCSIETAEARAAQEIATQGSSLPITPINDETVLTTFWADNFNMQRDTLSGKAVLDITNIVAFQEKGSLDSVAAKRVSVPKDTKRSLPDDESSPVEKPRVDSKKEPATFPTTTIWQEIDEEDVLKADKSIMVWCLLRLLGSHDQTLPVLSGWLMQMRNSVAEIQVQKTFEAFLPPISTSITDPSTIYRLLLFLQRLSMEVNMPYVNITMDVGAAMTAYKVLWNFPQKFNNVMLHLGDFHCMKENFGVIGKLIAGSGFEDIIFQANICSSGCLNGILSGTHYNRCWAIHDLFNEALERLMLHAYIQQANMVLPDVIHNLINVTDMDNLLALLDEDEIKQFVAGYEIFKSNVRTGVCGRTAQFWLVYYLDLMKSQHMLHTSVQENNYNVRRYAWQFMLPFYFGLNKTNYARYGTYYSKCMEGIESLYPGNRQLIEKKGLSVQGQSRYALRTAIDQRGEQTINRDSKVAGGIKAFSADEKSILKWTLNRASQAENTSSLRKYSNTEPLGDIYKQVRPSSILVSEERVQKFVKVMSSEYINPFDPSLSKDELYNLSSGTPVKKELADGILGVESVGKCRHEEFVRDRLESNKTKFHDPIKRNKVSLFSDSAKKIKITAKGKVKIVEANRDVLGTLLAISTNHDRIIDFKKALEYPLTSVPLSLANADGTRRKNDKSDLMKILVENSSLDPANTLPAKETVAAYVVDLMALIRTFTTVPATFEALAFKVVSSIPKGYKRVDIIADAYLSQSIKSVERNRRGMAPKIIVRSTQSKLPRDFKCFLDNGENKTRLIELILSVLVSKKEDIIDILRCNEIYFSSYRKCTLITKENIREVPELNTQQEEADTKVVLHANHILINHGDGKVIIRSHSGDIDIAVIALSHFIDNGDRVILDSNTGKSRKVFKMSDIDLTPAQKIALIGFHAFTGNDYNSAFFCKGKRTCWKLLEKKPKFVDVFGKLGVAAVEEIEADLEEYVSFLYNIKGKHVNEARYVIFDRKYNKHNKAVDMSMLPPCQQTLKLHMLRSSFIAEEWRSAIESNHDGGNILENGWTESMDLRWPETMMPEDVQQLFVDNESEEFMGDSDESEAEDQT